jgi:glyoxylase-like metal-dependent hydrolase (beta-lactamase superfamily II)
MRYVIAKHWQRWTAVVVTIGSRPSACARRRQPAPRRRRSTKRAAATTRPFGKEAFSASADTTLRWTGNAGFLINSRGTTVMIDPLLQGFDMPMLIDLPLGPKDVPRLDAVLVTHADNDHYSLVLPVR